MDKDRKENVVFLYLGAGIAIGSFLALILIDTVLKDWFIISYGVRALAKARIVGKAATGFGLGMFIVRVIPLLKNAKRRREKQRQEVTSMRNRSEALANYAQDSANPSYTRQRLEQLRLDTPELDPLVERCLKQMNIMDILQDKQDALIEANDARYLKDTISVLDNVERRICRNFRNVINLCIAADTVDSIDADEISRYIHDNDKKLNDSRELLKASADWINQYNAGEDSDRSEVENWIAVIRDSLRED